MTKYLLKRLLNGVVSVCIVVGIVMVMIYSMLDRNLVFAQDPNYTKAANNQKEAYKYRKWEEFGYIDYVTYAEYINALAAEGEIDEETRAAVVKFGKTPENDKENVSEYVAKFTEYYESQGYQVIRLNAKMQNAKKYLNGGQEQLFAYKDLPLWNRLVKYFTSLLRVDNIHNVAEIADEDRGITFSLSDPLYGEDKFAPTLIGNGTTHKYLLYTDNKFPYIHQNLVSLNLGVSYTINNGVDVFTTMTQTQGSFVKSQVSYPTGLVEESADDLHSATYAAGSRTSNPVLADRFTDDYTNVQTVKTGLSRMGYSFVIGIIATLLTYLLGVPMGIWMALEKDKLVDKLGTIYIVFIIAVPSLAYIFLFKAIGGSVFKLPTTFEIDSKSTAMYVLPIISLALPAVGNLMKWLRRYMIDQMNADYVKFARSGGLSEGEIFRKHILKNAAIPIIHGIPGSVLGCLTGAIITERVYVVPGVGNVLTSAINRYDNGVIVGVTLFYAVLSVVSIILGDILMSLVDPRISFSSKAR